MSNQPMKMERIPVRLPDDSIVYTQGYRIGCYSFGPRLLRNGGTNWKRCAIRSAETGINIAVFTDRNVAINFLRWLWNTYGDISEAMRRCTDRCETPEDAKMLDAINERAKHSTRIPGSSTD